MRTPVAFIIFNRPDTTYRVFEEIRRVRPPKLLVVADGPRSDQSGEEQLVMTTRAIIDQIDWPCEVLKNYSDANLGCKRRVSSGIDWVFSLVEEAIILEDDCLPSSCFFDFCENLLEKYRYNKTVMMIGGTNYLLDTLAVNEAYCFSRYFAIWGWATWRRAWKQYDITMKGWQTYKNSGKLREYYSQDFMVRYITDMFDLAYSERINTWDIQWFYSCLFAGGLSAIPRVNLISNIGVDGIHSTGRSKSHFFPVFEFDMNQYPFPDSVRANPMYDEVYFSKYFKQSLAGRIRDTLYKLFRNVNT